MLFLPPKQLFVPKAVITAVLAHLEQVFPEEGCGFLAGTGEHVSHWVAVENVLHSQTVFEMHPEAQLRAMLAVEEAGLRMLAVFHSHPFGPPRPSPTDIAQAYYPEWAQVIVALRPFPSQVRCFTIVNEQSREIPLITV